jgi:hypothetical protein
MPLEAKIIPPSVAENQVSFSYVTSNAGANTAISAAL